MAQETANVDQTTDATVNTQTTGSTTTVDPNFSSDEVLKFPLRDQEDYKGRIRFRVVEVESITPAIFKSLQNVDFSTILDRIIALGQAPSSRQEAKEAEDALNGVDGDVVSFENRSKQKNYRGSVTMYLPASVQISDTVRYDNNVNLGQIGAVTERGLGAGAGIAQASASGIQRGIDSFVDAITGGGAGDAAQVAVSGVSNRAGTGVGGAVKSQTRVTVNPNTRSIFQDVPLRPFSIRFEMVATSPQEAEEIQKIIRFFRSELYPGLIKAGSEGDESLVDPVAIGYRMPNPFEIRMTYDNKPVFTDLLDSYLTGVSTTYNQNGAAFHVVNGKPTPAEVAIELQFTESRALTREDIREGF